MREVLPDGRVKYSYPSGNVRYYTPTPRTKGRAAPGAPDARRGHRWLTSGELLPEEARIMPQTVPHDVVEEHPFSCACWPCRDYGAVAAQLKRRYRGLRG